MTFVLVPIQILLTICMSAQLQLLDDSLQTYLSIRQVVFEIHNCIMNLLQTSALPLRIIQTELTFYVYSLHREFTE